MKQLIALLLILSFSGASLAVPIEYKVKFDQNSPVKNITLKNTPMKIEVYSGGNPQGRIDVITNEEQKFILEDNNLPAVAVEVTAVGDESKNNVKCSGNAAPLATEITLTCDEK